MSQHLPVIDLFAGAGGLSLGFEQAGFTPALGTDSDKRAMAAYAANFPNSQTMVADIATLTGEGLLREADLESCAAVIGGPPCAAFSVGGLRREADDRRGLLAEFGRIVQEVGSDYFVLENVPGILLAGASGIIETFRSSMADAGYNVMEPWVLNAADFGVPQRRQRVFVVGARRDRPLPQRPIPSGEPPPTARDAIGDLEALEECASAPLGLPNQLGPPSAYAAQLRAESRDESDVTLPGTMAPILSGCERVNHAPRITQRFKSVRPGIREPISRFLRLHPDRPAPTLRAGTLPDHGKHTAPRPIHYEFPRCITVREAARLHSIPDWFQVDRTKWRGFMQVGNAVPPLLARAVALAVKDAANTERPTVL